MKITITDNINEARFFEDYQSADAYIDIHNTPETQFCFRTLLARCMICIEVFHVDGLAIGYISHV